MKRDCFAYDELKNGCTILNRTSCGKCTFFKTNEQFRASEKAHDAALRAKTIEEQSRIADLYYGGRMPWLKRSEL